MNVRSKIELEGGRHNVKPSQAADVVTGIFKHVGCNETIASEVAEHLVDADLCGVESHGIMRTLQYVEQFENGLMRPDVMPVVTANTFGTTEVDGQGGIGIPAMSVAVQHSCETARQDGITALAVRNVGHTGRIGAFVEQAANQGCLMIIIGGGGRQKWRQVTPYGGRQGLLPTNPYSIGIPGGARGPVVLDFATSKIAGGWIYAAKNAGALLPDNAVINSEGTITRDPDDYFNGGAILPAGGAKGYALSVVAELIAEAMLGPTQTECNWLMITLDTNRYREPHTMQAVAEEILNELRQCPPAPGFDKVEVPGERERDYRKYSQATGITVPIQTWQQILDLEMRLSI